MLIQSIARTKSLRRRHLKTSEKVAVVRLTVAQNTLKRYTSSEKNSKFIEILTRRVAPYFFGGLKMRKDKIPSASPPKN